MCVCVPFLRLVLYSNVDDRGVEGGVCAAVEGL